jgi:hypothetical protein
MSTFLFWGDANVSLPDSFLGIINLLDFLLGHPAVAPDKLDVLGLFDCALMFTSLFDWPKVAWGRIMQLLEPILCYPEDHPKTSHETSGLPASTIFYNIAI